MTLQGKEVRGMDIAIKRIDGRAFLKVGNEVVELKDYKISSSMTGGTELEISILLHEDISEFVTSTTQEP